MPTIMYLLRINISKKISGLHKKIIGLRFLRIGIYILRMGIYVFPTHLRKEILHLLLNFFFVVSFQYSHN